MRLATVVFLALALTGCATWSNAELRTAYHVANAADAGMTLARDPACMSEGNPFLGGDPSNATVALFAVAQSALYELICSNADEQEKTCRVAFLWVKLATDAWNISTLARGCE